MLDFDKTVLHERIEDFRNQRISDEDIEQKYKLKDTHDWKLSTRRKSLSSYLEWEKHFTKCLYRPFDTRDYYHHDDVVERSRNEVVKHLLLGENYGLLWIRPLSPNYDFSVLAGDTIPHQCAVGDKMAGAGASYVAPLYLYPDPDKANMLFDTQEEQSTAPGGRRPICRQRLLAR